MSKAFFFLIVICFVLFSCNSSTKHYNPDIVKYKDLDKYEDSVQLNDVLTLNADIRNLLCIDNYLIISQDNNDSLFVVMDTSNDSLISCFGRIGHARNEFYTTPGIIYCVRDKDDSPLLCVWEETCTKVIDLRKSIESNTCILSDVIKEKKNSFFSHTYHLTGNKSFVYKTVSYKDPRDDIYFPPVYCFIDDDVKEWNIYPEIIQPQFKSSVFGDYSNTMSLSPDGMHLVSVSHYIDIITIFDFGKKQSVGFINPDSYTYDYLEDEITESNAEERIRLYNFSACATDQCFIVLEDGKTLKERAECIGNGVDNIGLKLHGYNWEGKSQFVFNVDKNISYIAYNETNKKIYATDLLNGKLYNCIVKLQ